MEVQYLHTRREYQHAVWRITMSRPASRRAVFLMPAYGSVMILALLFALGLPLGAVWPAVLAGALLFLALIPLTQHLMRMQAGKVYDIQSKAPSWCEYTVRLEPDYLFFQSAMVKSELRWEAVTRIAEDEQGFYLYISPINAHFIPRRVFVSAAEAQQFWALAQSYHAHARKTRGAVAA